MVAKAKEEAAVSSVALEVSGDGTWTWTMEDKARLEDLFHTEVPATTCEVKKTLEKLKKPLRIWPELYVTLQPIRKLVNPHILFKWGEEPSAAHTLLRRGCLCDDNTVLFFSPRSMYQCVLKEAKV